METVDLRGAAKLEKEYSNYPEFKLTLKIVNVQKK